MSAFRSGYRAGSVRHICQLCDNSARSTRRRAVLPDKEPWAPWYFRGPFRTQRGDDKSDLCIGDLTTIMRLQARLDLLTGEELLLPSGNMEGFNWTTWLEALSEPERARTPVLTRLLTADGWNLGNVFFTSQRLHQLYAYCGNLHVLRELCHTVIECTNAMRVAVPQKAAIMLRRPKPKQRGRSHKQNKAQDTQQETPDES